MVSPVANRLYDVAVVGSGPAGSSAALSLASYGATVALIERKRLPRYKTCGGGLVLRARKFLPVDVSDIVERECRAAEINALQSGIRLVVERDEPLISMTMRDQLDFRLARAAQQAGADLWTGCTVLGVEAHQDRVELATSNGSLAARFVVAADGVLSGLARAAGWPENRKLIPALECEVSVGVGTLERFGRTARFDFEVVPHGYAWVFPKREHLSVGVLSARRGAVQLPAQLERYYRLLGLVGIQKEERHGSLIPFGVRKSGFVRGRVLLVGDAAGFADPLTGEGISFAILSGQIAGQVLSEADFAPEYVRRLYHDRLAHSILRELRLARRLAWLVYRFPRLRARGLRFHGQRIAEHLADVFCGHTTYQSSFPGPVGYLKMIRRPTRA